MINIQALKKSLEDAKSQLKAETRKKTALDKSKKSLLWVNEALRLNVRTLTKVKMKLENEDIVRLKQELQKAVGDKNEALQKMEVKMICFV